MDQARSVTANYVHQFQLSLATAPGAANIPLTAITGASDGDWFDTSTVVNLTAAQDELQSGGSRYHFDHWSGDSSDTTLDTSVTMDQARSVTANYVHQFQLSLATAPGAANIPLTAITGASDGDWFDTSTVVNLTAAQDELQSGGSRYHFDHWSGDSSDTTLDTSVTMDQARSVTANYVHQFQLSLATAPGAANIPLTAITGASDGDWFDTSTVVNLTAAQDELQSGGSRYHFDHWSGDSTTPRSTPR